MPGALTANIWCAPTTSPVRAWYSSAARRLISISIESFVAKRIFTSAPDLQRLISKSTLVAEFYKSTQVLFLSSLLPA